MSDFAKSAAVAWVMSPFLLLSSSMHLSRAKPYCIRSVTFCSVKLSEDVISRAEAAGVPEEAAVAPAAAVEEDEVEAESSCFRRFDS